MTTEEKNSLLMTADAGGGGYGSLGEDRGGRGSSAPQARVVGAAGQPQHTPASPPPSAPESARLAPPRPLLQPNSRSPSPGATEVRREAGHRRSLLYLALLGFVALLGLCVYLVLINSVKIERTRFLDFVDWTAPKPHRPQCDKSMTPLSGNTFNVRLHGSALINYSNLNVVAPFTLTSKSDLRSRLAQANCSHIRVAALGNTTQEANGESKAVIYVACASPELLVSAAAIAPSNVSTIQGSINDMPSIFLHDPLDQASPCAMCGTSYEMIGPLIRIVADCLIECYEFNMTDVREGLISTVVDRYANISCWSMQDDTVTAANHVLGQIPEAVSALGIGMPMLLVALKQLMDTLSKDDAAGGRRVRHRNLSRTMSCLRFCVVVGFGVVIGLIIRGALIYAQASKDTITTLVGIPCAAALGTNISNIGASHTFIEGENMWASDLEGRDAFNLSRSFSVLRTFERFPIKSPTSLRDDLLAAVPVNFSSSLVRPDASSNALVAAVEIFFCGNAFCLRAVHYAAPAPSYQQFDFSALPAHPFNDEVAEIIRPAYDCNATVVSEGDGSFSFSGGCLGDVAAIYLPEEVSNMIGIVCERVQEIVLEAPQERVVHEGNLGDIFSGVVATISAVASLVVLAMLAAVMQACGCTTTRCQTEGARAICAEALVRLQQRSKYVKAKIFVLASYFAAFAALALFSAYVAAEAKKDGDKYYAVQTMAFDQGPDENGNLPDCHSYTIASGNYFHKSAQAAAVNPFVDYVLVSVSEPVVLTNIKAFEALISQATNVSAMSRALGQGLATAELFLIGDSVSVWMIRFVPSIVQVLDPNVLINFFVQDVRSSVHFALNCSANISITATEADYSGGCLREPVGLRVEELRVEALGIMLENFPTVDCMAEESRQLGDLDIQKFLCGFFSIMGVMCLLTIIIIIIELADGSTSDDSAEKDAEQGAAAPHPTAQPQLQRNGFEDNPRTPLLELADH